MQVQVRLFFGLQKHLPKNSGKNSCSVEISEGDSVKDILCKLGIPPQRISGLLILANGAHVNLDHVPKDGDVISVFPAIAGG